MDRREFLRVGGGAMAGIALGGCATSRPGAARVIVVGAGYGGATAAKYLKLWAPHLDVTLVERNAEFVSCPLSNLVLGGSMSIADVTVGFDALQRRFGVRLMRAEALAVDVDRRRLRLADGAALAFDRIILSPGVDFQYGQIPGLNTDAAQARVLHAWKAGAQTVQLRRQLEAMRDGGVFAISIPELPYRCPPAPYECACVVAAYFRRAKPKSKILILDANADVTAEPALFKRVWAERYGGMVEHRPNSRLVDVDAQNLVAKLEVEDAAADVLNVLPPMKAGAIADPFITVNGRWCEVNWLTYESKAAPGVHILGDALQTAPLMPKSGHIANAHAKVCAAAVIAMLDGNPVNTAPVLVSTCYSFVSAEQAMHVASVHKYDKVEKTMLPVPGAGGLSVSPNELEAQYAMSWARNIWADMLG
ncbi:MAG: FAD-dependent oxidoreductase [Betaproteobacteria bacterium]|nr:FAD-dependent oxidoreductase [Betaproteobacteria bacterium]